jgi:Zn-dependent M28 family amino/carboxypeptidase
MKKYSIIIFLLICNYNFLFSQNEIEKYRSNEITKDEIFQHIKYLASDELEGRLAGSNGDLLAENYLIQEFKYYKLIPAGDSLYFQNFILKDNSKTANIIGFLEGNDPVLKNEVILIGAHYDHLGYGSFGSRYTGNEKLIHYGADDNASGTAGVLELAEKMSSIQGKLKRSYLFICFGAEEEGLIGSAYFTKSSLFNKYNIISMINLDMVGRLNNKKTLIISGIGSSNIWDSLVTAINKNYDFTLSLNSESIGGSDHTSFFLKDKPVLYFFTGIHEDYHKPSDTYDKINPEGEVKILEMVFDVLMSLDTREIKPEFVKLDKSKKEEIKGDKKATSKVYTGTIPDFTEEVEGYKISGVTPGSPADNAGLKAGDIIIKFGDREIKNISDYMNALSEHIPDEEVDFIVLRNGVKINLKIKLGVKK